MDHTLTCEEMQAVNEVVQVSEFCLVYILPPCQSCFETVLDSDGHRFKKSQLRISSYNHISCFRPLISATLTPFML